MEGEKKIIKFDSLDDLMRHQAQLKSSSYIGTWKKYPGSAFLMNTAFTNIFKPETIVGYYDHPSKLLTWKQALNRRIRAYINHQ